MYSELSTGDRALQWSAVGSEVCGLLPLAHSLKERLLPEPYYIYKWPVFKVLSALKFSSQDQVCVLEIIHVFFIHWLKFLTSFLSLLASNTLKAIRWEGTRKHQGTYKYNPRVKLRMNTEKKAINTGHVCMGEGRRVVFVVRRERSGVFKGGQSHMGLMIHRQAQPQNEPHKYQNTVLPLYPLNPHMDTDYKIYNWCYKVTQSYFYNHTESQTSR